MSLSAKDLLLAGAAVGIATIAAWAWSAEGSPDAPESPIVAVAAPAAAPSPSAPASTTTPAPAERQQVAKGGAKLRGAHIRDDDTLFDWGTLPAGETFKHTFVLHNDGDAALHIQKTRPSWGCAAVAFDRDILPGGEGRLEVTINGKMLKPGRAMVRIDVTCNDAFGEALLIMTGQVTAAGTPATGPAASAPSPGAAAKH